MSSETTTVNIRKAALTSVERQRRRRQQLDQIARAAGYDTWSKLETAAISGEIRIEKGQDDEKI